MLFRSGITTRALQNLCKNSKKIVRVMPNLCAQVGESVNAYTSIGLSREEESDIKGLLDSFGKSYVIDEIYFDTITGLTGSGPAYMFRFIKNMIECGVEGGLSFEQSRNMVLSVAIGSAKLLSSCECINGIQTMINNVCSKGGTTIEGIYALDEGNFDEVSKSAVKSAIRRSKELGK